MKKKSVASSYKLELARFSTLHRIQDRANCGKEGGTPRRKDIYWKGGHCTYLIEVGTPHIPYWGGDTAHTFLGWGHRTYLIGVGTPHNMENPRWSLVWQYGTSNIEVVGWPGGRPV